MRLVATALIFLSASVARADDADLLKKAGLPSDDKGLIAYFQKATLSVDDARPLRFLVGLNNPSREKLDEMVAAFKAAGPRSRAMLETSIAQFNDTKLADVETKKRLGDLLNEWINKAPPSDVVSAAIRVVIASKDPARLKTLWDYAVRSADDGEREEILDAIAADDQTHAPPRFLLSAMKDDWPGAADLAAYAVARYFDPTFRENAILVSSRGASRGLLGAAFVDGLRDSQADAKDALVRLAGADADDFLRERVKDGRVPTEIEFLRKQTLSKEDLARIGDWIRDLGATDFRKRDKASEQLAQLGASALPMLREAEQSEDAEVRRRAYQCIEEIRRKPMPEIAIAAIRSLAWNPKRFEDEGTVKTLLDYVPFTDRRDVEDTLLAGTAYASIRAGGVIAPLIDALKDEAPARRAMAAWVIGKVGTPASLAKLRPLLDDPNPLVRLRAAQAFISLDHAEGVPRLIRAIGDVNPAYLGEIEDPLVSLAKENAPKISLVDHTPANLAKAQAAWTDWHKQQKSIDFTRLKRNEGYEGTVMICENDPQNPNQSKVWQRARDGRERWTIDKLRSPIAFHALPNGHVLVAESLGRRVVEFDATGKEVWEYQPVNNPVAVKRLPNGNTFIATYNALMEVAPDKSVVYNYQKAIGFVHFGADRTRDGRIVVVTSRSTVVEYEAATGKELRTIANVQAIGQCHIQALAQNRFLITSPGTNGGQIREIDADGKVLWENNFQGAWKAIKLPNGNVLACSLATRRVAEIDRDGRVRWEITCQGRPWALQAR